MKTFLPTSVSEVLITQKCNLNCSYCFEKHKSNKNIDFDLFLKALGNDKFSAIPVKNFYIFGGEPLENPEFYEKSIDYISSSYSMLSEKDKVKLIRSIAEGITTNGTLIDKHIDLLKKYKCSLQVSLDGPEDINDACRVDYAGNGHFKQILKNLEKLRDAGISYHIHGALSKANYSSFKRINEFFLEQRIKSIGFKSIEQVFNKNYLQIVFEDDITDDDIDIILDQFHETIKMILETPLLDGLSYETRKVIAAGFLCKTGALCSAGSTMYAYDDKFNVFPCHRQATNTKDIKENRLTSLIDDNSSINYKLYLQYQEVFLRREAYGACFDNFNFTGDTSWLNWCPSTNREVTGSAFSMPSKHTVLISEINRLAKALADYYDLDLNNPIFRR